MMTRNVHIHHAAKGTEEHHNWSDAKLSPMVRAWRETGFRPLDTMGTKLVLRYRDTTITIENWYDADTML